MSHPCITYMRLRAEARKGSIHWAELAAAAIPEGGYCTYPVMTVLLRSRSKGVVRLRSILVFYSQLLNNHVKHCVNTVAHNELWT